VFVRTRCRRHGTTLDLVCSTWTEAGPRQRFVASFGTLGRHSNCHRRLLERARDRLAGLPLSAAERAKAARALCATLRRLGRGVAHQFEVGLAAHAEHPKPRLASLHGWRNVAMGSGEAKMAAVLPLRSRSRHGRRATFRRWRSRRALKLRHGFPAHDDALQYINVRRQGAN
jgi:hypothetical protein